MGLCTFGCGLLYYPLCVSEEYIRYNSVRFTSGLNTFRHSLECNLHMGQFFGKVWKISYNLSQAKLKSYYWRGAEGTRWL